MTEPEPGHATSGFFIKGSTGMVSQLALRSYDSESLAELEPLHELVDGIVKGHKTLVPGRLYPPLVEWRDQLASVIEAKSDETGEHGKPSDRYTEIGYDKNETFRIS